MDADPGGARWCEEHERFECTRFKHGKVPCHGSRIRGTDRCKTHSGTSVKVAKAQGEARITAWSATGGQPDMGPAEAVLRMLQMSWLRVHLYAGLLERQVAETGDSGGWVDGAEPVGHGAGLVGHTFAAAREEHGSRIFATGEAIRALAQLEATERDRCVRYAKTAHDMGIAEREIRVAEQQGELLASAVRAIADALLAAVLGLVGEVAGRADFTERAVTEAISTAWPGWLGDIAPREIRAVSERESA